MRYDGTDCPSLSVHIYHHFILKESPFKGEKSAFPHIRWRNGQIWGKFVASLPKRR
jgi:hypothetical protein